MNTVPSKLAIIIFALSYLPTVLAEDGDWYVAPSIVYTDDDGHRAVADTLSGIQVGVGRDMTDHLTLEGLLGYSKLDGYVDCCEAYPDQDIFELGANLLLYPNRDWAFAPYMTLGVGFMNGNLEYGGSDSGVSTTIGVGFDWRLGSGKYSIRTEVRSRTTDGTLAVAGTEGSLSDIVATVGLKIRFGQKPEPVNDDADTDGDGVLDLWDECPKTPRGAQVSARGCELRDIQRDADGDRVPDEGDTCPNTPTGVAVDIFGCALDSDGDGVVSGQDRCPASRPGAQVDKYGCEADDDGDGVLNQFDDCEYTTPGVRVDVRGCEIEDVIRLPGVNFESGSDRLIGGVGPLLEQAAATLIKHPDLKIEVAGHTDSVGLSEANFGLSERRAITVRDALINLGVAENSISAMGYGETQPVTGNNTADGRATNRRVELRIISR